MCYPLELKSAGELRACVEHRLRVILLKGVGTWGSYMRTSISHWLRMACGEDIPQPLLS